VEFRSFRLDRGKKKGAVDPLARPCVACGYDLRHRVIDDLCPECGQPAWCSVTTGVLAWPRPYVLRAARGLRLAFLGYVAWLLTTPALLLAGLFTEVSSWCSGAAALVAKAVLVFFIVVGILLLLLGFVLPALGWATFTGLTRHWDDDEPRGLRRWRLTVRISSPFLLVLPFLTIVGTLVTWELESELVDALLLVSFCLTMGLWFVQIGAGGAHCQVFALYLGGRGIVAEAQKIMGIRFLVLMLIGAGLCCLPIELLAFLGAMVVILLPFGAAGSTANVLHKLRKRLQSVLLEYDAAHWPGGDGSG
jgi:hypothetical protein